jgi:hypothetical protein
MGDIDPNNDPTVVVDSTPFPDPALYFKVFDSERDEPGARYREDVNKLYARWEAKYGRKWPENGLNTDDLVWLYNEAYADEAAAAAGGGGSGGDQPGPSLGRRAAARRSVPGVPRTYPREKQDYEGQVRSAIHCKMGRRTARGAGQRAAVSSQQPSRSWRLGMPQRQCMNNCYCYK